MNPLERGLIGCIALGVIVAAVLWMGVSRERFGAFVRATLAATFVLVVLGAFVRLSDAGLGCPDWPGCYGSLTPNHSQHDIQAAEAAQPGGPVSMAKAWKEMVHRYLAMLVGACISAIAVTAWRNRKAFGQSPVLPTVLVALVILQAALGAWTVTMLLRPAIVTSHLLGGLATLSLLCWLMLREGGPEHRVIMPADTRALAPLALGVVIAQVMLGGWVSTNYAALACSDFPTCNGAWLPQMDFRNAFHVIRPLGMGPDGALLTLDALRAIHWTHRIGALAAAVAVGAFGLVLRRSIVFRRSAHVLLGLLGLQIGLGITNVVGGLPLPVAVAHNAVAALLLMWLVYLNFKLYRTARH